MNLTRAAKWCPFFSASPFSLVSGPFIDASGVRARCDHSTVEELLGIWLRREGQRREKKKFAGFRLVATLLAFRSRYEYFRVISQPKPLTRVGDIFQGLRRSARTEVASASGANLAVA
jgi:hypothetical protein